MLRSQISVIGLGYIGLPTCIILALSGHSVKGFDVNKAVVDSLNAGEVHIKEPGMQAQLDDARASGDIEISSELKPADVYIIAVPTPFTEDADGAKHADLCHVEAAVSDISKLLKRGDLVILESTSPPGTTRHMTDLLEEQSGIPRDEFHTAHCPERVMPGNMFYELSYNNRIIGSESRISAEKTKALYESFVRSGEIHITDDVTAELAKLAENTFRDVNIAFANELAEIAHEAGVDVKDLIALANKHPRVNILSPSIGVGGHCIAVDPYFLIDAFGKDSGIMAKARSINAAKPGKVASMAEERLGYDRTKTIAILGLAYKANVDDLRESPSIKLAHILLDAGYHVAGVEPNVSSTCIDGIDNIALDVALERYDFIILALAHKEFIDQLELIKQKDHMSFI